MRTSLVVPQITTFLKHRCLKYIVAERSIAREMTVGSTGVQRLN